MANTTSSGSNREGGLRLVRQDLVAAEYSGASNLMFNELIKEWMVRQDNAVICCCAVAMQCDAVQLQRDCSER